MKRCTADLISSMVARLETIFEVGTDSVFQAPVIYSLGVDSDDTFAPIRIIDTKFNDADRDVPVSPSVIVRCTSIARITENYVKYRQATVHFELVFQWKQVADKDFAWVAWDRIEADLSDMPFLINSAWALNEDSLQCSESVELSEAYGAYVLVASVTAQVPANAPTRGPDGNLLAIENMPFGSEL